MIRMCVNGDHALSKNKTASDVIKMVESLHSVSFTFESVPLTNREDARAYAITMSTKYPKSYNVKAASLDDHGTIYPHISVQFSTNKTVCGEENEARAKRAKQFISKSIEFGFIK
jgi:hypothetical protein